jgi:hypothetical protein
MTTANKQQWTALVGALESVVQQRVGLTEGCRKIFAIGNSLELESELFNPFCGYESESDLFPLGEVRKLWSESGLADMDRQRESTEAHYHDWIMAAAEKLLAYAREQEEQMAVPYKVRVVVDRQFGERLAALEPDVPVWMVDTSANKPVAQRLWKERDTNDHLTGITTFNDAAASSPEEILIARVGRHRPASRLVFVPSSVHDHRSGRLASQRTGQRRASKIWLQ